MFATGMSNGGMFSYTLACEMSEVFAAIASVTDTDGNFSCVPQDPISIFHIHAKDDTHVLFNGGAGKDTLQDPSKVTDFVSVPQTIGFGSSVMVVKQALAESWKSMVRIVISMTIAVRVRRSNYA